MRWHKSCTSYRPSSCSSTCLLLRQENLLFLFSTVCQPEETLFHRLDWTVTLRGSDREGDTGRDNRPLDQQNLHKYNDEVFLGDDNVFAFFCRRLILISDHLILRTEEPLLLTSFHRENSPVASSIPRQFCHLI